MDVRAEVAGAWLFLSDMCSSCWQVAAEFSGQYPFLPRLRLQGKEQPSKSFLGAIKRKKPKTVTYWITSLRGFPLLEQPVKPQRLLSSRLQTAQQLGFSTGLCLLFGFTNFGFSM